jgi:hypothetical protein
VIEWTFTDEIPHSGHSLTRGRKTVGRTSVRWGERHADLLTWFRVHFFRFWTATVVVFLFGFCFWYAPELLTGWQRMVLSLIQSGSEMLPYPWSNRVQYVMINFGASIWLQFTLAIILLRVLCWPVARWLRHRQRRQRRDSDRMPDPTRADLEL